MSDDVPADGGGLSDLSAERARALLEHACVPAGLEPIDAELVRLGECGVFRLLGGSVIARVARSAAYEADARKEIAVARWLATADYPATRALEVEQPVLVDGSVVTFWEALSDATTYATLPEVGALLRRLHHLEPPTWLGLPTLHPFGRTERRIASSPGLTSQDRLFLQQHLKDLRARYDALEFALPPGVIHGDANIGNVIRDRQGQATLIDLDGFAVGPPEWDLAITATYYDSFGWHTRGEYDQFCQSYGFDVMQWPGFPTLQAIRELIMVSWLSQKATDEERIAVELRHRIHDLRTGGSRAGWQPY